jgi:glycerophosphoryl diester phosphodiesterase
VLELLAGRSLLLVEIKAGPQGSQVLAERVGALLSRYFGAAAAISFDPEALAVLAQRYPDLPRGLDALWPPDDEEALAAFELAIETAQPQFLVLELESALSEPARRHRAAGLPVIAWTVRSPEEAAKVAPCSDNVIFEGFDI